MLIHLKHIIMALWLLYGCCAGLGCAYKVACEKEYKWLTGADNETPTMYQCNIRSNTKCNVIFKADGSVEFQMIPKVSQPSNFLNHLLGISAIGAKAVQGNLANDDTSINIYE